MKSKGAVVDLPSLAALLGAWQYNAVRTRPDKRFIASISQTEKSINRSMIAYLPDPTPIKANGTTPPM